jgi:hypothetical protein
VRIACTSPVRGTRRGEDGPAAGSAWPLEALPSSSRVRHLLERRAEAADDIEAEWGWLPADARAALPAPDDLLAGA